MVTLDIGGDGIVHLRLCPPYAAGDEESYLETLDRIGALERPYAMVVDISGDVHLSRDGEKRQTKWAKSSRAQISQTCRALALVREKPDPRSQQSFARLWAIPVYVTSNPIEAMAFARAHLGDRRSLS